MEKYRFSDAFYAFWLAKISLIQKSLKRVFVIKITLWKI